VSASHESAVRRGADERAVRERALVLAAAGIPHRMVFEGEECVLLVAAGDAAAARSMLEEYEREIGASAEAPSPARQGAAAAAAGLAVAAVLIGVHAVADERWYGAGRLVAGRVQAGEWWRAVTALTLHADVAHLAGNAVVAAVVVSALCRTVGVGLGLWLVLLAGAGGNLLAAAWRPPAATSIGASTAVFGAIGALGALAYARRRQGRGPGRRPWVAVAASLALLALLGSDKRADLPAHLAGLVCGLAAGAAAAPLPRPGPTVQRALTLTAAAALAAAWLRALSG